MPVTVPGRRRPPRRRVDMAGAAALGLLAGILWLGAGARAGAGAVAVQPSQPALYGGFATLAAPDDPLRAFGVPAGPALVEGSRVGAAVTIRDGVTPAGHPSFAHGVAVASGAGGRGYAFSLEHGGTSSASGAVGLAVLRAGYTAAARLAPGLGAGVTVYYRRERDGWEGELGSRDDHYLGVSGGLLAELGRGFSAALALDRLVEVRQFSRAGPADPQAAGGPMLHIGVAYRPGPEYTLEMGLADLLNAGGQRAARVEARLHVARAAVVRLGLSQPLSARWPGAGWMAGFAVALPDSRWAVSYAYLGGQPEGGMHQLGLLQVGT